MVRKILSVMVLIVMALNIFSAPAFASQCPGMSGGVEAVSDIMDSPMPCHDNLANCLEDCGCSAMLSALSFIMTDNAVLYPVIAGKEQVTMLDYDLISQNISPLKRPPRI